VDALCKETLFPLSDVSETRHERATSHGEHCSERVLRVCCVIVCHQVLRVVPGSKLFLFNYRVKEMSGIFEATGHGGMNIVQDAFKGLFPAQVFTLFLHNPLEIQFFCV
jgi:hypothetical protein